MSALTAFRFVRRSAALLLATLSLLPFAGTGSAQTLTTLHGFQGSDGANPASSLTQAGDGNFYGTTPAGGDHGTGTVYRITPAGVLTTIYSFSTPDDNGNSADGSRPTAGLTLAGDGNLYGAAQTGGTAGFGSVFKITTDGGFTNLYSFKTSDGNNPIAAPVQGGDGNLYGTTLNGGAGGFGTVYRITPAGALTTLHAFAAGEGYAPSAPLVTGNDGNFYGTTRYGGSNGVGTIFRIGQDGGFSTVYSFGGNTGANPTGTLVRGSGNLLYGATPSGGNEGLGAVFKITTDGAFATVYSVRAADGAAHAGPAGLTVGGDGNLYVTTLGGGSNGRGSLFSLTPAGAITGLFVFTGNANGSFPQAALTQGRDGNFYGTTSSGGANADGTVFKLAVVTHPPFFAGEAALAQGVYYLAFPVNGNIFGYYEYLSDPNYVYHFDLGFEYVFNAGDGAGGVYLYDFKSGDFFYTSPTFPFPYLYDFTLKAFLYYYPDPTNPQRYNTNGVRYFYNFSTNQTIVR